jgi:hypothetical protein
LSCAEIAQAYPLVHTLLPRVSLQRWQDYAHELLACADAARRAPASGDAGIVAVVRVLPRPEPETPDTPESPDTPDTPGTIVGLSGYRLAVDLNCGPTLDVDPFLALDLFDSLEVARRLLGVHEAFAAAANCAVVHLRLHEQIAGSGENWLVPLLAEAGHRLEARCSCKTLDSLI